MMCSTAPPSTTTSTTTTPPSISTLPNHQSSIKHFNFHHQHHLHDTLLVGHNLLTTATPMELKLRCSGSGCECGNFIASKDRLRTCDVCTHSWITHLFEKLLRDETLSVFDVCSLVLYGTHALPIRLKIVIERLLATLQTEEIDKILRSFGWTPSDLARGYMIQDPRNGGLLGRWSMLPREEEILILQQFLRFSPTRNLSFALLRDDFPSIPAQLSSTNQPSLSSSHSSNRSNTKQPDEPALNLSSTPPTQPPPADLTSSEDEEEEIDEDLVDEDEEMTQQSPPVDLSSKKIKSPTNTIPPPPPSSSSSQTNEQHHKTETPKGENGSSGHHHHHSLPPPPSSHHHRHHWSHSSATQLVNPTTGKRRVQCSVCMKTFCDKGALKIHFSAVHLREMHKCTVAGCNMMFSSRRSRNRHSANPNPKLHSPHLRRRISPHDGRTSQPLIPINSGILGQLPHALIPQNFTNGLKEEDNNPDDDSESSVSLSSTSDKSIVRSRDEGRKDGARKRKLSNPVRLPSVRDDSNDDFCCYDDGTEVLVGGGGDNDSHEDDKNHLERLESLPIFTTTSSPFHPHSDSGGSIEDSSPTSTDDSIPIDKENPKRCIACGKLFPNQFGLKTHYQNVHLKCTVDGCNAAFPSKRSRDRHSANLNLHRKLLSTTSDGSNGSMDDPPIPSTPPIQHNSRQQPNIFNPFLVNGSPPTLNHVPNPPWNPFLPFPLFPAGVFNSATGISNPLLLNSPRCSHDCRYCGKGFEDGISLNSHMESVHSSEGITCKHCNLIFFSRRKLGNHNCRHSPSNGID